MAELKSRARYRELVKDFKPDSGHLLHALHTIQHQYGYIPNDAVPVVAQQLGMQTAKVFGAITFYAEFRTSPPPKTEINWCSGPTCRLKGGDNIRRAMEATLGYGVEGISAGGDHGMHLQQCDGSCEYAPLVWVRRFTGHSSGPDAVLEDERGEVHGPLTVPAAIELARRLKSGEASA